MASTAPFDDHALPPKCPLRPTIYEGSVMSTPSLNELEMLPHARIGVSTTGRIDFIHRAPPFPPLPPPFDDPSTTIIRASSEKNQFFFPGFVGNSWLTPRTLPTTTILISTPDTHTHPPQTPNIGLMPPSLLEWLDRYTYPLETRLSLPSSIPLATQILAKHIHKSLSCGTTSSCYFSTISVGTTNVLSTLCYTLGQRALVGRVNMDRPSTTPDDYRDASVASAVSDTRATIAHCRRIDPAATLVEAIITPRFAPSCTKELLGALGHLAGEEGVRVQTHLSECKGEIVLVEELFREAQNYTGVYDEAGLLDKGTVLAHCVHLSTEEMHILSLRGAGVAHCPTSNLALGSGLCKVRRLLNESVKVGLGSDVSGGWCVGMLEVARVGLGVSATVEGMSDDENLDRRLGVGEILYLATKGGAAVLGLQAKGVGGFEVGGVWDAQLVELGIPVGQIPAGSDHANEREGPSGPVDLWGEENWEEKLGKWVWGGDERNTVAVWVGGREVYRSGLHACNRSRVVCTTMEGSS